MKPSLLYESVTDHFVVEASQWPRWRNFRWRVTLDVFAIGVWLDAGGVCQIEDVIAQYGVCTDRDRYTLATVGPRFGTPPTSVMTIVADSA